MSFIAGACLRNRLARRRKIINEPWSFDVGDTVYSMLPDGTMFSGFITKKRNWARTYTFNVNRRSQVKTTKFTTHSGDGKITIKTRKLLLCEVVSNLFSDPAE